MPVVKMYDINVKRLIYIFELLHSSATPSERLMELQPDNINLALEEATWLKAKWSLRVNKLVPHVIGGYHSQSRYGIFYIGINFKDLAATRHLPRETL